MNTIIERLSQIEERSVAAAAEGTEKKKELTAQYEEQCLFSNVRRIFRQFDRELDQETEERIRKLREQADAAANARIQSQEKEAAQSIQQLERHYDAFHKDYVDRLFREMTGV